MLQHVKIVVNTILDKYDALGKTNGACSTYQKTANKYNAQSLTTLNGVQFLPKYSYFQLYQNIDSTRKQTGSNNEIYCLTYTNRNLQRG